MAKGKHSTALFEVINSGKLSDPERRSSALRTPKWWFKGRQENGEPAPAPAAPSFSSEDTDPTERAITPEPPRASAAPVYRNHGESTRSSPRFSRSAVHLDLDRDRHEITLRLRYTTAVVSAFSVLVVIGLAYVLGRHISQGPQTASAFDDTRTEALLRGAPQPGVIEIGNRANRTSNGGTGNNAVRHSSDPSKVRETPAHEPVRHETAPKDPPVVADDPNANVVHGLPRKAKYQYVVMQSYPDDKTANAALDFLNKNGVQCTIESMDFAPGWRVVVGTTGFKSYKGSKDYEKYVDSIKELNLKLNDKLPRGTTHFNRFDPMPIGWK